LLVPGAYSTPVALAFTGITPQEFTFILWFCIAVCPYVCQDSLIGKERMSRPVGGKKMKVLNLEDVIVEAATELAISGECDVPVENKFGGVDLVAPGYYENRKFSAFLNTNFSDYVRISVEDQTVHIYKFEKGSVASHTTLQGSAICSEFIVYVAKGLLS
jgi:hypothetical protein